MMGLVTPKAVPDLPERLPARDRAGRSRSASAARCSATRRPRAPRSSRSWARSTCGRAGPSSTPRRTASSRWRRTRTCIPLEELYRICRIGYEIACVRPRRLPRDRASLRRAVRGTEFKRTPNRARLPGAAPGRDAPRSAGRRGLARVRGGEDRGHLHRPRASAGPSTRESDSDGIDQTLEAMDDVRPRADLHATSWTSTRSTGTGTTSRATRATSRRVDARLRRGAGPRCATTTSSSLTGTTGAIPATPRPTTRGSTCRLLVRGARVKAGHGPGRPDELRRPGGHAGRELRRARPRGRPVVPGRAVGPPEPPSP